MNQPQGILVSFKLHPSAWKKKSPVINHQMWWFLHASTFPKLSPLFICRLNLGLGARGAQHQSFFCMIFFFTRVGLKNCNRSHWCHWLYVLQQREQKILSKELCVSTTWEEFQCAGSAVRGNQYCKIFSTKQRFWTVKPRVYVGLSLEIFKSEKSDNVQVIVCTGLSPVTLLICFHSLGTFLHTMA